MRWPFFALALLPSLAFGGDPQRAALLKGEADQAFADGDYILALKTLDEAIAEDPQPGFIANRGLVLEKLGEYRAAADAFTEYLATDPPEERAVLARQALDRVAPEVTLTSSPPGAKVKVDDEPKPRGVTPLTVRLPVGPHRLSLVKEGCGDAQLSVRLKPGKSVEADGRLVCKAAPVQPTTLGEGDGAEDHNYQTWGFVSLGGGALAAGAAGALYVLASSEVDARDSATTGSEWDDHQSKAESLHTGFVVSTGLALAALTGAGILLYQGWDEDYVRVTPTAEGAAVVLRF